MNEENVIEMPKASSWKDRVKKILANRKVQIGATIVITAVVSAVIARSEIFQPKYTIDDVGEIVNDVIQDMIDYPIT